MLRPFSCGLAVCTAGVMAWSGAGYCAGARSTPQRNQPPPAQPSSAPAIAQQVHLLVTEAVEPHPSPASHQAGSLRPRENGREGNLAFEPSQQGELEALLAARLEQLGWTLVVVRGHRNPGEWLDTLRPEAAAIGVVLVANPQDWVLYLVDVERQLAVRRSLAGTHEDAAAAEAVTSIIVSAAEFFQWGLPVGSEAVQSALSDVLEPPPKRTRPQEEAPQRHSTVTRLEPRAATRWALALGGEVRSWVRAERFSAGPQLQVLLALSSLPVHWGARVAAGYHLPSEFESLWGQFQLQRSIVGLHVGPHWRVGELTFGGELGLELEVARRGNSRAEPNAQPVTASSRLLRPGIGAAAFGALALAPLWALRVSLQGNHWLSTTRYLASNEAELLAPSPTALALTLALCWQLAN